MTSPRQPGIAGILHKAPIVPVMVIDRLDVALPMARALVRGGLPVLEITLRTDVAIDAIRTIMSEVEGAIVGAGTVLNARQLVEMDALGCAFAVSPGSTPGLLAATRDVRLPLLPGGVTASECMSLLEQGFPYQKFFPAEAAGGVACLASLASPLPQVSFCPTGGITPELAPAYLRLPNVITLGGSWMVPRQLVETGDWVGIENLARQAASLR